jgi:hypothetical protein
MDPNINNDHDLLIELKTEMKNIKEVLIDIKNGTVTIQTDHENRLRKLEKSQDILLGKIVGSSAVISIIIVIAGAIIQGIHK